MPSFCPVRVLTMMDFKSLSQSPGYFSLDKGCLIYHHVSCAQHILRHTVELSSTCYLNKAEPLKLCVAPGHPQSRPRGETEIPQREYSLRRWWPWTKQWLLHPRTPKLKFTRARLGPKGGKRSRKSAKREVSHLFNTGWSQTWPQRKEQLFPDTRSQQVRNTVWYYRRTISITMSILMPC